MRIKDGLKHVTHYFALATLYGDVGGTYEPQRMDWYRARYATDLPDLLPAKCMYVHVTNDSVELILRGGNKAGQDADQDLSDVSPLLASTLREWMPHAKSAQPGEEYPHVICGERVMRSVNVISRAMRKRTDRRLTTKTTTLERW